MSAVDYCAGTAAIDEPCSAGHRRPEFVGGGCRFGDRSGNPPTLAVLAWQWLNLGDPLQQAKGALASLLLLAFTLIFAAIASVGWRRWRQTIPALCGKRAAPANAATGHIWRRRYPPAVWFARCCWLAFHNGRSQRLRRSATASGWR